eukprot:g44984.t1
MAAFDRDGIIYQHLALSLGCRDLLALSQTCRAWHRRAGGRAAHKSFPAKAVSQAQPDVSLALHYISCTLPDARARLLQSVLSCFARVRRLSVSGHPRAVAKLLAAWSSAHTSANICLHRLDLTISRPPAGASFGSWSAPVLPALAALAPRLRQLSLSNIDLGLRGLGGLGCRALQKLELHACARARLSGPDFQRLAPHLQRISVTHAGPQLQEPADVMFWPGPARWPRLKTVNLDCTVGLLPLLHGASTGGLTWDPDLTPQLTAYQLRVSACQSMLTAEPGAEHFPGLARGSLQQLAARLLPRGFRPAWLDLELLNLGSRHATLDADLSALQMLRPSVLAVVDRGSGAAPALARAFLAQPGHHKRELAIALAMPTRNVLLTDCPVLDDSSRLQRWARRWEKVLADPPGPPPLFRFVSFNLCSYIYHFIRRGQRDPGPLLEVQNRLLRALCRLPVAVNAYVSFLCGRTVRGRTSAPRARVRGSYTLLRAWPRNAAGGGGTVYSCLRGQFCEDSPTFLACAGLGGPAVAGRIPWQRPWQEGGALRLLLADYLKGQIARLSRLYQQGQDCAICVQNVARTVEQLCRHAPAADCFVLEDPMPRRLLQLLASRLLNGVSTAVLTVFDEHRWWRLVTLRLDNLLATIAVGG